VGPTCLGDVNVDGGNPLARIRSKSGWDRRGGARWILRSL